MKRMITALAGLAWSAGGWAMDDYKCTIESVLSADGEPSFRQYSVGKEFTVDRQSGRMAGELKNSYGDVVPEVIDLGYTGNGYKVIATRRATVTLPGASIWALNILEYRTTKRKPFLYLDNEEVFKGWCEHF